MRNESEIRPWRVGDIAEIESYDRQGKKIRVLGEIVKLSEPDFECEFKPFDSTLFPYPTIFPTFLELNRVNELDLIARLA